MEQKKVLLTLKSKHSIENPDLTRAQVINAFDNGDWESDTGEFLDEWEDDEYYDDFDEEEPGDEEEIRYPKKLTGELQARFDRLMEVIFNLDDTADEEDEEFYVLKSEAIMTRAEENGSEILEITYEENPTLDNTTTTLRFDSAHPESVVIMRNGGLVNTIICEKGVRHVSYYSPAGITLPFPIQMTVYTRQFEGSMTFENGGHVEMDYMTAMHGLDKQRTTMKITVIPE